MDLRVIKASNEAFSINVTFIIYTFCISKNMAELLAIANCCQSSKKCSLEPMLCYSYKTYNHTLLGLIYLFSNVLITAGALPLMINP